MRACRQNPKLSAHTALDGEFHYDSTPMAPPGTLTLAQVKPNIRGSWEFHAREGWYVGPAMRHYRCYTVIAKNTGAEIISDTVKFKHHAIVVPTITPTDHLIHATDTLTRALRGAPQEQAPNHIEAVERLRRILKERHDERTSEGGRSSHAHSTSPTSEGVGNKPPVQEREQGCSENVGTNIPTTRAPEKSTDSAIPIITQEANDDNNDEGEMPQETPTCRHRYRLRSLSQQLINSIIITEPRNVTYFKNPRALGSPPTNEIIHPPAFEDPLVPLNFANAILDPDTGKEMEYRHLIKDQRYKKV